MLVIGDIGRWEARGRELPSVERCVFADHTELTAELLNGVRPDFVVSALISDSFDAVEIATRLVQLGFKGVYRSIVERLPNAAAVRREVRGAAPGLDFDILVIDVTGSETENVELPRRG